MQPPEGVCLLGTLVPCLRHDLPKLVEIPSGLDLPLTGRAVDGPLTDLGVAIQRRITHRIEAPAAAVEGVVDEGHAVGSGWVYQLAKCMASAQVLKDQASMPA